MVFSTFSILFPRRPGIWKFNSSLLADEAFCDFVSERISSMPVHQHNTVVIHEHGMVAARSSNVLVQMLSEKLDFAKVRSI